MKKVIHVPAVEQEWLYVPDVVYQTIDGIDRKLQLIIPYRRQWPDGLRLPVVINIPGSAWYRQEMYNGILNHSRLAQRGYVMVDVQYRESTLAKFPAQIEDIQAALAFLPTIAEQFHMDLNNVFIMGDSSGAHLALMTALTTGYPFQGVVSFFAPSDLTKLQPDGPAGNLLSSWEQAEEASCQRFITAEHPVPPVLLLHGTEDELVNVEQSRNLYKLLQNAGKEVTYIELESENHGGGTWWNDPVTTMVEEFLREHCR